MIKYFLVISSAVVFTVTGAQAFVDYGRAGQPTGTARSGTTDSRDLPFQRTSSRPSTKPEAAKEKKPLTATLTKDEAGKTSATTFATSAPKIFLVWKDDTAAKGDKVRVVWIAEDTGGAISKNKKLTEFSQTLPGPGAFGSAFLPAPSGGFPAGKYRADVYDGEKLVKSLKFTVKK